MTVKELIPALGLNTFHLYNPELSVTGGYAGDLLSWVMGRAQEGDAWFTIMSNQNVAAVSLITGASCVILTEGVAPDEALLQRAQEKNVNLLGTGSSTYDACSALHRLLNP